MASEEVGQHQIHAFNFQVSISIVIESHQAREELETLLLAPALTALSPSQRGWYIPALQQPTYRGASGPIPPCIYGAAALPALVKI